MSRQTRKTRLQILLLALMASLGLVQCNSMSSAGYATVRYGQQFFGQTVPRVARGGYNGIAGLFGPHDNSFWYADEMRGKPSIVINLSEQMVYLFKGGELAGGSPISSGSEAYGTQPGRYRILDKDVDHKSSIYGDYEDYYGNVIMTNIDNRKDRKPPGTRFEGAKMYYFMRIYGGVGMHQGYLPGYPASHGCIRLPGHMAEKFYRAAPVGTPVSIVR